MTTMTTSTPDSATYEIPLDTQITSSQFIEYNLRRKQNALRDARFFADDAARDITNAVEKLGGCTALLNIANAQTRWHADHEEEIARITQIARWAISQLMVLHASVKIEMAEALRPAEDAAQKAFAEQSRKTGQLMTARSTPPATPQS